MEGAAAFAARGAVAEVTLEVRPLSDAGAVAVDLDSRRRTRAAAHTRVLACSAALRQADVLVKTIDSTLRGHVAAEVDAALAGSGRAVALIAPAFPAAGRTTVGGVQLADGRPVAGAYADDPRHPPITSDLSDLFAGAAVAGTDSAAIPRRARYVIFDATTDGDLDRVVAAGADRDVLWVGSPGLLRALARRTVRPAKVARPSATRIAVVVGSRHAANAPQLARLFASLGANAATVDDGYAAPSSDVAVVTPPMSSGRLTATNVVAALAHLSARAVALVAAGFDGLIVTGGETARAVVTALGVTAVEVCAEPLPGIAAGRVVASGRQLTFVSKAGAFGEPDTILRLIGWLRSQG